MKVEICVGSSCHLKGTEKIVQEFTKEIANNHLENEVTLSGMFCAGLCNRDGVTIRVDGVPYTGITPSNFGTFFIDKVLSKINK